VQKVPKVSVKNLARHVERTGRFEIFRKVKAARVTPSLIAELDRILSEFARREADAVTRRWYANRRSEGTPAGELANLTLAYYERALRKLRPNFELDFALKGEERSCRYRGARPFLIWFTRQCQIRPKALKVSYLSPSANVLVQLKSSAAADRSYLWAAGDDGARLERLFGKLHDALAASAGKWAWLRSRQANLTYASACALACALGLAFKLHGAAWVTVFGAATLADVAVASALIALFRQAWPQIEYRLEGVDRAGRRQLTLLRALYLAAALALLLAGSRAIFTSFIRIVW
jgi:hypothetical protein